MATLVSYSFVYSQISLTSLVHKCKIPKNTLSQGRLVRQQGSFLHEHARPLNKRCVWRLTTGSAFIKMARLKAIVIKTKQGKTRKEDAWFYRWHILNLQGQINTWAGTKGRKHGTLKNTKYRKNAEPLQVKLRSQWYLSYIIASFQKPVYSKNVLLLHAHLLLKNASCQNISRSFTSIIMVNNTNKAFLGWIDSIVRYF